MFLNLPKLYVKLKIILIAIYIFKQIFIIYLAQLEIPNKVISKSRNFFNSVE